MTNLIGIWFKKHARINNVKWEESTEELDMQLSKTATIVNDLEKFVDSLRDTPINMQENIQNSKHKQQDK